MTMTKAEAQALVKKTLRANVLAQQRVDALTGELSTAPADVRAEAQAAADATFKAYKAAYDANAAIPVVKVDPIRMCDCGISGRGWVCPDCSSDEYYG